MFCSKTQLFVYIVCHVDDTEIGLKGALSGIALIAFIGWITL